MEFTDTLETLIKEHVDEICSERTMVEMQKDLITTDNLGEVIEKFVILHIRTWMLEDRVGVATEDAEVASIKKKIDICFKQKRPAYIEAINRMIDNAIIEGKTLVEDSVKSYEGHK
tara:strand:- start:805 stop:1152 length:348 start_codon:yes stop_codon:yes gene_type:complete